MAHTLVMISNGINGDYMKCARRRLVFFFLNWPQNLLAIADTQAHLCVTEPHFTFVPATLVTLGRIDRSRLIYVHHKRNR